MLLNSRDLKHSLHKKVSLNKLTTLRLYIRQERYAQEVLTSTLNSELVLGLGWVKMCSSGLMLMWAPKIAQSFSCYSQDFIGGFRSDIHWSNKSDLKTTVTNLIRLVQLKWKQPARSEQPLARYYSEFHIYLQTRLQLGTTYNWPMVFSVESTLYYLDMTWQTNILLESVYLGKSPFQHLWTLIQQVIIWVGKSPTLLLLESETQAVSGNS